RLADEQLDVRLCAGRGSVIVDRGRHARHGPGGDERHAEAQMRDRDVAHALLADVDEDGPRPRLDALPERRRVAALPGGPGGTLEVSEEVSFTVLELGRGAAQHVLDSAERTGQVGVAVR